MKAFKNSEDIGTVVGMIVPDKSEITEDMLERWAWMVRNATEMRAQLMILEQQFQIVDYKGSDDDFWRDLDGVLAKRRQEAAKQPEAAREAWFQE
jgi:hypothetical protein